MPLLLKWRTPAVLQALALVLVACVRHTWGLACEATGLCSLDHCTPFFGEIGASKWLQGPRRQP